VVTQYPGYLLRMGSDEIDLRIFVDLVSQGRSLARQQLHEQAIDRFEQALRLWRGPLLGDLRGGPIIDGFGTWLLESRLDCLELLAESSLLLGRHRELIGRLFSGIYRSAVRRRSNRLDERALLRCGQQHQQNQDLLSSSMTSTASPTPLRNVNPRWRSVRCRAAIWTASASTSAP